MKVLFDTNVVSELRRSAPDPRVVDHVRNVPSDEGYISVVTLGELVYGVRRLTPGKRRDELETWLATLEQAYAQRILSIDSEVARIWGEIAAACEAKGHPLQPQDGLIAATALRHGLHLMTRDSAGLEHTGALIINPWNS